MTTAVLAILGGDLPVRILAVVGGAALGAFLIGWLAQVVVKLAFAQSLPETRVTER